MTDLPPAKARVRVRPGSDDAEAIEGYASKGTVQYSAEDDRGPHMVIQLDSGQTVWTTSPGDWEELTDSRDGAVRTTA